MRRKLSVLVFLTVLLPGWSFGTYAQSMSITATSWLVADEDGRIIQGENIIQPRSIASITKLMTAMIILDANQDLAQFIGRFTRKELLQMMLISSNNLAAEQLCQYYPTGRVGCINAMNLKAKSLGLEYTHYTDPSGLGVMNVSTAKELVKVVIAASKYQNIVEASNTARGDIKHNKQHIKFKNTNPLVSKKDFIISKTGYIRASGGCIVMMLDTDQGRRIVVLLNSKNTHTRIPEADQLAMLF
jgi:D-alanyl-D-alanine endopeptidase (penicillin-binding protein 7)